MGSEVLGQQTLETILPANPAAGAELTHTVPAGQTWRIQSLTAELVTDATAPVRTVGIRIENAAGQLVAVSGVGITQGPSVTFVYGFGLGMPVGFGPIDPVGTDPPMVAGPLPDIILLTGFIILTATEALVAADQFQNARLLIERYNI